MKGHFFIYDCGHGHDHDEPQVSFGIFVQVHLNEYGGLDEEVIMEQSHHRTKTCVGDSCHALLQVGETHSLDNVLRIYKGSHEQLGKMPRCEEETSLHLQRLEDTKGGVGVSHLLG